MNSLYLQDGGEADIAALDEFLAGVRKSAVDHIRKGIQVACVAQPALTPVRDATGQVVDHRYDGEVLGVAIGRIQVSIEAKAG